MEFYSHDGGLYVNKRRFKLKGCSWFGGETDTRCVHGLWSHSAEKFLDFLVAQKFNALRLPFTAELALNLDTTYPTSINYHENRVLEGKSAGQVMDYIIHEASKRGLLVLLDMHCLTCQLGITPLWYTPEFPEAKLIQAWSIVASRYKHAWNVFGADIKNEPHGAATWGDNNPRTDWRLAAQRIGNAVLRVNPRLLIFVEGTTGGQVPVNTPEGAFWGGSLASARQSPIELCIPGKLVYCPHVYGPGVYMQEYFKDASFPWNMPDIWTRQWGHLLQHPKAGPAVVVGEWGGRFKEGDIESTWLQAYVQYLLSIGATDQFFWCLNPNSGDTGGLLEDDWETPCKHKLDMLHKLCPDASMIKVDANGHPTEIAHGGHLFEGPYNTTSKLLQGIESFAGKLYPHHSSQSHAAQSPSDQPQSRALQSPSSQPQSSQCQLQRPDSDSHTNLQHKVQKNVHGIEVDASALSSVECTASIVNQWTDGQRGQECQVDFRLRNVGHSPLADIQLKIVPGDKIRQVWNMRCTEGKGCYGLPEYFASRGGLRAQEEHQWGGIFSMTDLRVIFSQA